MTEKEKQLLLIDLCARLHYNPYIFIEEDNIKTLLTSIEVDKDGIVEIWYNGTPYSIEAIKPYLRSMSSMTEEEEIYYNTIYTTLKFYEKEDWLNAHHFDYRGLIEKGLALEAKNGMYKTE